jgi:hypothetical protein
MKTYVLPKIGSQFSRRYRHFEEAVEQEIITRNPAAKTHIPEEAAEADETVLTKQNPFDLIDSILDPRGRAIFAVGCFRALRTSELFSMSWRAFHYDPKTRESYFSITETAYRGTRARRRPRRKQAGPMSLFRRYLSLTGRLDTYTEWYLMWSARHSRPMAINSPGSCNHQARTGRV